MQEKRSVLRQRTFLKGVLSFHNGNSSEDCLVRDLSERGAQIELPHPLAPHGFDLLIPARALRARACVVWTNGVRRGLRFESADMADARARRAAPQDDGRY